jgi:hypothetical protein
MRSCRPLFVALAFALVTSSAAACTSAAGEESPNFLPASQAACPKTNPPPYSNGFLAKIGPDRGTGYGIRDVRGDGPTPVTLADCSFSPTVVRAKPWTELTISLTNTSNAEHNFSVPSESISVDVPGGQTRAVRVQIPGTGGVEFLCRFHRSDGMIGAIEASGYDLRDVLAAPPGDLAVGSIGSGAYRGVGHIGPGTTNLDNRGRAAKPAAGSGKEY